MPQRKSRIKSILLFLTYILNDLKPYCQSVRCKVWIFVLATMVFNMELSWLEGTPAIEVFRSLLWCILISYFIDVSLPISLQDDDHCQTPMMTFHKKLFSRDWSVARGISTMDSPHMGPVMWSSFIFLHVSINMLLNKQSNFWLFEALWRSNDVTVRDPISYIQSGDSYCYPPAYIVVGMEPLMAQYLWYVYKIDT